MIYRTLGRTGFEVSAVSFGAWAIGGFWGAVDDETSMAALHAAVDAGVNFIDTADVYPLGGTMEDSGRTESIVGKWLLVGRFKEERIPVWSARYFRFWAAKTLMRNAPVALFAGQVPLSFGSVSTALPHVRAGRLRGLAVTDVRRLAGAPDVPTFAEAGMPGFHGAPWFGLIGPAGVPAAIVAQVQGDISKLLREPKIRESLARGGAEIPNDTSTAAFGKLMQTEYDRYMRLVKEAGLRAP